jgi:NTE family protein
VARPINLPASARKPVGLALQGGGSWGAYTWGALDALLASRSVEIRQLSGTSAGAINAAIVAGSLAKGSPVHARKALRSFWRSIAHPAPSDIVRSLWGPLERQWRNSTNDLLLTSGIMSLYGASAPAIKPLRDATREARRHRCDTQQIGASAFRDRHERAKRPAACHLECRHVDRRAARLCLPARLVPAVEIDGEFYWDGGYGGNPTLWPMIHSGLADDLILVQLVPDRIEQVPTDSLSIRRRVGEIVFHSSLVAEMQAIHAMRVLGDTRNAEGRFARLRLHRIGPPRLQLFEQGNSIERARAGFSCCTTRAPGRQAVHRPSRPRHRPTRNARYRHLLH